MQSFKAKKVVPCISYFDAASLLRNLPFHAFAPQTRIEPGCDGWKPTTVTTTPSSLQQHDKKMSYLKQMYEKGNGSICEEKNIGYSGVIRDMGYIETPWGNSGQE